MYSYHFAQFELKRPRDKHLLNSKALNFFKYYRLKKSLVKWKHFLVCQELIMRKMQKISIKRIWKLKKSAIKQLRLSAIEKHNSRVRVNKSMMYYRFNTLNKSFDSWINSISLSREKRHKNTIAILHWAKSIKSLYFHAFKQELLTQSQIKLKEQKALISYE